MKNQLTLLEAIQNKEPVNGYTHDFYRYPARFSPLFVRSIIEYFTEPGDLVFDPFMGSGTTLVEARALARHAIGTDISSLAVFIAKAKTSFLSGSDLKVVRQWGESLGRYLNLRNRTGPFVEHPKDYYQRNIGGKSEWPIKKTIELALHSIDALEKPRARQLARCVVLRTAQWALDCKKEVPTAAQTRGQLLMFLEGMLAGVTQLEDASRLSQRQFRLSGVRTNCIRASAIGIDKNETVISCGPPALILTSPPYPGIHVLYHRWQVLGRRETPAPFWIAGTQDGHGSSFYTMGDRHRSNLATYYDQSFRAFESLARLCDQKTIIVQMVAFSDLSWQLPMYLETMKRAGLIEVKQENLSNSSDGRIWRSVPNRKWYADLRGTAGGSTEVVLFHRLNKGLVR
jgi:DNA methylase